jgi:hypothetical protein
MFGRGAEGEILHCDAAIGLSLIQVLGRVSLT